MKKLNIVALSAVAGVSAVLGAAVLNTTAGAKSVTNTSNAPRPSSENTTLWGIYGEHSVHDCPVNNRQTAEYVVQAGKTDLTPLLKKYGVTQVHDRYHSGLEHTFLWVVETTRPHDLEEFAIELGIAKWNNLRFVPLRTFEDGVAPVVAELHGLN